VNFKFNLGAKGRFATNTRPRCEGWFDGQDEQPIQELGGQRRKREYNLSGLSASAWDGCFRVSRTVAENTKEYNPSGERFQVSDS